MNQSFLAAMDIPTPQGLLAMIDLFRERHDIAETRFGRDSVNNPAFIRELREGKSPTLATLNKVQDYMRAKDAEAKLKAPPPLELTAPREEEEVRLPFGMAPATGASCATGFPTPDRPISPSFSRASSAGARASGNSHCSSDEAEEPAK